MSIKNFVHASIIIYYVPLIRIEHASDAQCKLVTRWPRQLHARCLNLLEPRAGYVLLHI